MKHIITLAAVACAFALHAATFYNLKNGLNDIESSGEIVAIEANTVSGSQVITASVETAVSEYTNVYKSVTSRHLRYDFTVTNYDGNASIATSCLDRFVKSNWYTTNGLYKVISPITTAPTNITESVIAGKALKATYSHETAIGNGTASNHYLKITPASTTYFIGGKIKCSCGDGDSVRILIK